ncbi:uncharacterized protein LOC144904382 [Branchiostoma floridae x Branchiostoma belcheri]
MLIAISETSHTSDSHTESEEQSIQNPQLLARIKQELAKEDLSLEERNKICKLKMELRKDELDLIYMHGEREVKILKEATFLSQQSLETKYNEIQAKFEHERAVVKRVYKDCLIFFLDFETKSNFEHFWASYTSGRLSDTLSRVLTADQVQRLQHGDQLVHVVRTLVLMEDYRAWRDFFRKGLDCTTSVDNLLTLPPPARHVDHSSSSGLDLAMVGRQNQCCTDGTEGIPTLTFTVRQVQTAMQTAKEKSQRQLRRLEGEHREQMHEAREQTDAMVRSLTKEIARLKEKDEKAQKILFEQKEKNQKLSEANKSMAATIEEQMYALQTAKPKGGGQEEDPGRERGKEEDSQQSQQETNVETMQGQEETGRIGEDAMKNEVKLLKEEEEKAEKIPLEQKAVMKMRIQELQARIEMLQLQLQLAKQPVASGSQQKDPAQTKSDQHSKATNTGQVKQSVFQGFTSTGVERPWVKRVKFGGLGCGRGEFVNPMGVAVSKDNEVYIADRGNSRIQALTMGGVYIREFTTSLPGETGERFSTLDVAVDRNYNLWVVSEKHVVQYSREGTCLATIDLPHVGYLRGIAVAMATEQVIVTEHDGQNGRLRVFNKDGSEVGTYGSGHRSPEPWHPEYVTVDGEGNILVTDSNNDCVHVLDREGNFKFKLGSEGSHESGDVVVTDFIDDTVSVWTQG